MTTDARPSLTTVEKAALLLEVDLFHDVPSDALAELAARMEEGSHAPGDVLLEPGAPDVRLWVVLSGRVRVGREADGATEHGPGAAVGLLALLGVVDDESVIVDEPCRTLSVTPEDYLDALADNPAFALANLRALGRRLRASEGRPTRPPT
ncbi:hypothetical protein TBR22_A11610 [Luteitalea sp. TBR-22]|uniref:Crp/Fnr family transcriptional regulator n=1 Tax=Luteitalea sp. TBR-22 TaxID=2802971 RepID=UPI001AF1FF57|nr:Crp/Fnr family transcriptional regulator [Luteitalea sp. TBR-22]BCS31957.1 hypothetical protein TBR22_A11610 [Luteitalea sp. TBR-22]